MNNHNNNSEVLHLRDPRERQRGERKEAQDERRMDGEREREGGRERGVDVEKLVIKEVPTTSRRGGASPTW